MYGPYILLMIFGFLTLLTGICLIFVLSDMVKDSFVSSKYHLLRNVVAFVMIILSAITFAGFGATEIIKNYTKAEVEDYKIFQQTIETLNKNENNNIDIEITQQINYYNQWLKDAKENKSKKGIWSKYYFENLNSLNFIELKKGDE